MIGLSLSPAFMLAAGWSAVVAAVIFLAVAGGVIVWAEPFRRFILRREAYFDRVLRGTLLLDIAPRTVTILCFCIIAFLALVAYVMSGNIFVAAIAAGVGVFSPWVVLRFLKARRLYRLEEQLVGGIQTLTSGVRAGLNLVQAMDLLARNDVKPMSEEFSHLVREYEHGISLEKAMSNASKRIGSGNYRLLFAALLTHRERGGDLGGTLDRIADSIREIYRLEKRIETLTAPNRTAARWMGAMPAVILGILYFIDPEGVTMLFTEEVGRLILLIIVALNIVGFLWIRKIVAIDI